MNRYSVFTKPWPALPVPELIRLVASMGYNAVEFPLREGFQVTPARAEAELPRLARAFEDAGLVIDDVASSLEERVFAACAKSGIGLIRVMFILPDAPDYLAQESQCVRALEAALPLCRRYGVKIGVQVHCGRGPSNASAAMRIVSRFDPAQVGVVWDAAHSGLAGEDCAQSIDIAWSHLCLVNFKNARYRLEGRGPEGEAQFSPFFCPARDGACPWPRAVGHLLDRGYAGTWCMPAEYTQAERTVEYAARDLAWLRTLAERT